MVNDSVSRVPGSLRSYSLAIPSKSGTYTGQIITNGTLVGAAFSTNQSSITFQAFTPSGYKGFVELQIPVALRYNGTKLTVNGSARTFVTVSQEEFTRIDFLLPSSWSLVSFFFSETLPTTTTTNTLTTSTTGTETTSTGSSSSATEAVTTQTATTPTSSTGGPSPNLLSGYAIYLLIAVMILAVLTAGFMLVRRRKRTIDSPE